MDSIQSSLLEIILRQRQLELWDVVLQTYEIEPSLNAKVRMWIRTGKIEEEAFRAMRRRKKLEKS